MELTDEQALQLLFNTAIHDLKNEIESAREAHPQNSMMMTALCEEVGELAKALLEGNSNYYEEAIQVACVAIRIAVEGDAAHAFTTALR